MGYAEYIRENQSAITPIDIMFVAWFDSYSHLVMGCKEVQGDELQESVWISLDVSIKNKLLQLMFNSVQYCER